MKSNLKIVTPAILDHPRTLAREAIEDRKPTIHYHLWLTGDGGRTAACECGLQREAVIRKVQNTNRGINDHQIRNSVYKVKKLGR